MSYYKKTMNLEQKCVSMMSGIAIGDAFGAGYEGCPPLKAEHSPRLEEYKKNPYGWSHIQPGNYTDDTQMSLAVAELLCSGEPFTIETLAKYFTIAYHRDKRPGYSYRTGSALERSSGEEFLENINANSETNGAAMRAVPIGAVEDIADVLKYSIANAKATHNTKSAIASSEIVALASHYFFHELGDPGRVIGYCLGYMHDEPRAYLYDLLHMEKFNPVTVFGEDDADFGVPVHGLMTAGAMLYIISRNHNNAADTLREAVSLGGDTDTVASIALGIVASRTGLEQLPSVLIDNLENRAYGRNYLIEVGKKLSACCRLSAV